MPELPEVETIKNTLKKLVLNKKVIGVDVYYGNILANKTIDEFKNELVNQTIIDIKRRGKWLVFELNNKCLISHLRMEGKYYLKHPDEELSKHEHVVFHFKDCDLRYHDTRKFGKMYLLDKNSIDTSKPLSELGLEPWDDKLGVDYLRDKYIKKKLPIKSTLLDQSIIVGIGNIYADEILFLSKINPNKESCKLNDKELSNIIKYTKEVLYRAIEKGGTTIKSYESAKGVHGKFQDELLVHNQKICPTCKSELIKVCINGRSTYYCGTCQK